jgi:hypothetical protein
MQVLSFSAPLLVGGEAKVTYDVLLYRSSRALKPPGETPPLAGRSESTS